jgi:hypothetical protein
MAIQVHAAVRVTADATDKAAATTVDGPSNAT